MAPRGGKASSTRKIKPQTSNLVSGVLCVGRPRPLASCSLVCAPVRGVHGLLALVQRCARPACCVCGVRGPQLPVQGCARPCLVSLAPRRLLTNVRARCVAFLSSATWLLFVRGLCVVWLLRRFALSCVRRGSSVLLVCSCALRVFAVCCVFIRLVVDVWHLAPCLVCGQRRATLACLVASGRPPCL